MSVQEILHQVVAGGHRVPRHHYRLILADLLGRSPDFLMAHPESVVDAETREVFFKKVQSLVLGVPLSRVLGYREFWGLKFFLSPATLDPRPDSETLIEATLKHLYEQHLPYRFLDLGTGTGCLIISLLKEYPQAYGVAVDQSSDVLEMAASNARLHGVEDRLERCQGHWFSGVKGCFDVIISNPPYISERDFLNLDPVVKNHDPKPALVGGHDGLACYREIISEAPHFLKPGGLLVLEIGYGQREEVTFLLVSAGLKNINITYDLSGIERCVIATIC